MRIIHQVAVFLRSLMLGRRVDADLAEELRFHVDRETEANIARGMTPDAARRAARLIFGSVDDVQETSRDDRAGASLRQIARDLRFGVRLLVKAPVFAITGIAIVALGISAVTAIFSVVYGVMLRPLPFHEPDRLVTVWLQRHLARNFPAAADVDDLRRLPNVFADVALIRNINLNLVGDGEPQRLEASGVSPNFFAVLGVRPALGRPFAADEDAPGREHVVVLSDAMWRTRFASDQAIIGHRIQLNGLAYTVVGVMPPSVRYPSSTQHAWVPAVLEPGEHTRETTNNYRVVARLAAGVTLDQARRETAALAKRLSATLGSESFGMTVDSMLDDAVRDVRPALILLLGAVALLVVIASVNLSSLFAARAASRSSEFAVRLALGASRARLIAQAIAESVPLLISGGVLGVVGAIGALQAFVATAPPGIPRIQNVGLSVPVVVFAVLVLAIAGCAVSIAPALQAWRVDFTTITKDGGRSSTAGRGRTGGRRASVAAQIAIALPMLAGATVLIRSSLKLAEIDPGFRPERVATLKLEVPRAKYRSDADVANYYSRIVEAVRTIPGVSVAALVNRVPLTEGQTNLVRFKNDATADTRVNVDTRTITPEYFATVGIPLVAGRAFTERDDANAPVVAIVDERVARSTWPGEPALGKRFTGPDGRDATVVGVVGHIHATGLEVDPLPQIYWSVRQWTQNKAAVVARGGADPRALLPDLVRAVHSVHAEQAVYDVRTMGDIVSQSLARRQLTMTLVAAFSVVALVLAAVGIYGVVAYGVTQRLREFAIRMALGATRREVVGSVLRQGASMAVAGSIVGLLAGMAMSGAMSNLVFGVAPGDLASFAGATVVLLLVAALASYIPARRASRVEAAAALRAE